MRLCPRLLPARAHEPRREAEPSKPPSAVACAPARMWLFHSLLCVTSKSASPLAPQWAAVPSARPVRLCVWWGSEPEVREEVGPPPGGMLLLGGSDPPLGLGRAPEAPSDFGLLWTPGLCLLFLLPPPLPMRPLPPTRRPCQAAPQVCAALLLRVCKPTCPAEPPSLTQEGFS